MKIVRVFIGEYQGREIGDIHDSFDANQHPGSLLSGTIGEFDLPVELEAEKLAHLDVVVYDEKWTKLGEADLYVDPVDGTYTKVIGKFAEFSLNQGRKDADAAALVIANSEALVEGAIGIFNKVLKEFAGENIRLGITQDGQTGVVLTKLQGVMIAGQSGSLYEAIIRTKAIDPGDYDAKYITAARLLVLCNKIRVALGKAPAVNMAGVDNFA